MILQLSETIGMLMAAFVSKSLYLGRKCGRVAYCGIIRQWSHFGEVFNKDTDSIYRSYFQV